MSLLKENMVLLLSPLQKVFLPPITRIYFTDNELFAKYGMPLIAKNFVFIIDSMINTHNSFSEPE